MYCSRRRKPVLGACGKNFLFFTPPPIHTRSCPVVPSRLSLIAHAITIPSSKGVGAIHFLGDQVTGVAYDQARTRNAETTDAAKGRGNELEEHLYVGSLGRGTS